MLSSISQFPRDQFINCVKARPQAFQPFLIEIQNLNIEWIYQIIKHLHNFLIESKQLPQVKLNALKICKKVLESCQIPCLTLLEIYIVPTLFNIASYNPKGNEDSRGKRFFIDNGYSHRIAKIEQAGLEFVRLSTQMLFVGSLLKKKRILLNQELNQQSQFVNLYEKLKNIMKKSVASMATLKYFKQKDVGGCQKKYKEKLNRFEPQSEAYSSFFVRKMIESLQSEQNILFSVKNKSISSLSNDLDMRKFLKFGDSYITSPLIQQISDGLISSENFIVKKNFLSLLSDLLKFSDIEAILQVSYNDLIEEIAKQIAKVKGQKSLGEGQNIYPTIKGQREAKKKFYSQFLKSLQIWATIIKEDLIDDEESSNIQQIYEYFKVERRFIFPENLMIKHIESDYQKCKEYNKQKNEKVIIKLREDSQSNLHKKSKSLNKKSISLHAVKQSERLTGKTRPKNIKEVQRNLENLIQDFITLCDEEKQIDQKMERLLTFKNDFDDDLADLEEQPDQDELMEILDEGDGLIANFQPVIPIYNDYKNKRINLEKFRQQFEAALQTLQQQSRSNSMSQNSSQNAYIQGNILTNNPEINRSSNDSKNIIEKLQSSSKNKPENTMDLKHTQTHQKLQQKQKIQKIKESNKTENIKRPFHYNNDHIVHLENKSISSISKKSNISERLRSYKINQKKQENIMKSRLEEQGLVKNQTQNISHKNSVKSKIQEHRSIRSDNSMANESYFRGSCSRISKLNQSIKQKYHNKQSKLISKHDDLLQQSEKKGGVNKDQEIYQKSQISNIHPVKSSVLGRSLSGEMSMLSRRKSRLSSGSRVSSIRRKQSKINKSIRSNKQRKQQRDKKGQESNAIIQRNQVCQAYEMKRTNNHKDQKYNAKNEPEKNRRYENNYASSKTERFLQSPISPMSPITPISPMSPMSPMTPHQFVYPKSIQIDNYNIRPESENYLHNNGNQYKANYGIQGFQMQARINKNMSPSNSFLRKRDNGAIIKSITHNFVRSSPKPNDPHEEYLMFKRRKREEEQKNKDLRSIHEKIFRLKTQSSRLRSQLSSRSLRNKEYSVGRRPSSTNSQQSYQSFTRSKSSSNKSDYRSSRGSMGKKYSVISLEGRLINANEYNKNFVEQYSIQTKKTLLRKKCLVFKNSDIEIGSLFRRDKDNLKIFFYLTPEVHLRNLTYHVSEQKNITCQSYPESYKQISAKKQVKISFVVQLKSFYYKLPKIKFEYQVNSMQSVSVVLPCPLHKFVEFCPVLNTAQFEKVLNGNSSRALKTNQFRINRKVVRIDELKQYFSGLNLLSKQDNLVKYGATCKYMNQCFSIMVLVKGSNHIAMQGIAHSRPQFLEYFMSSLQQLMQNGS